MSNPWGSNPWGDQQPVDPPFEPPGGLEHGYGYPPPPPPASYPPPGATFQPYPGGYPTYPPGYRSDHPQAITAMVLGILGLVCCGLASPFAIWLGRKSMREIDASGGQVGGRGQAQAGFIMGIIGTALWVLGALFYVILFVIGMAATSNSYALMG